MTGDLHGRMSAMSETPELLPCPFCGVWLSLDLWRLKMVDVKR